MHVDCVDRTKSHTQNSGGKHKNKSTEQKNRLFFSEPISANFTHKLYILITLILCNFSIFPIHIFGGYLRISIVISEICERIRIELQNKKTNYKLAKLFCLQRHGVFPYLMRFPEQIPIHSRFFFLLRYVHTSKYGIKRHGYDTRS